MTRPPTTRAEPFLPVPHTSFTLDNGLRATRIEVGTVPKVHLRLVVRAGAVDEPAGQRWISKLAGELLKEGAGDRDGSALASAIAGLGGQLEVDAGEDVTVLRAQALSEFAPELIRILADVVRRPQLPDDEVPRLRNDLHRTLAMLQAQQSFLGLARFRGVLYGDHPYGQIMATAQGIDSLTADDVRAYIAQNFGARRGSLYIAGPHDRSAVETAIREAFEGWGTGNAPSMQPPSPRSERTVHLIDHPGAEQSTIYLGLAVPNPSSNDYVPLTVVNALIGGAFTSRITMNIREAKGYTYSPRSEVSARYRDAYWAEIADVTTAVTGPSLHEIYGELERLRAEPPTPAELEGIKNFVAGSFILRNATPGGLLDQRQFVDFHELGDSYVEHYIDRVYALEPDDVQRLAHEYLRPEAMTAVIVGDVQQIEGQLTEFQPIVR